MSVDNELTKVQQCVDELTRAVNRLQPALAGPDLRRVRADTDHLRESVALLRASAIAAAAPDERPPLPRQGLVPIPDTPYDTSLWTDSDDEGLGAHHRHAP
ncbi:hypothetical protein [Streptomyces sp. SGAir0957]